ncbi:hypothetical protein SAMN05421765_1615 [Kaistella antarctica]|uniref:Uncharacterized protein n=1 Tax=Kaistella antarctica TaxID=266748 RepID=A0A448NND0_9FLAO|nr:hypothetical protein HY04_00800 [Kaistella antarctica]SEV97546.1 hypothetical protein SAMN05421765_1615 [Kaistella antarctica]VEH96441.1 Uncharacterised protein [Kaistella antarctica]
MKISCPLYFIFNLGRPIRLPFPLFFVRAFSNAKKNELHLSRAADGILKFVIESFITGESLEKTIL